MKSARSILLKNMQFLNFVFLKGIVINIITYFHTYDDVTIIDVRVGLQ